MDNGRTEHDVYTRISIWCQDRRLTWGFFCARFPVTLSVTNSRATSSRSPVVTTSKVRGETEFYAMFLGV